MTTIQPRPLDINILPEQYRPWRITARVAVTTVVLAALLLGLIPAYTVLAVTRARTTEAQLRLDQAQVALTRAQVDQGQLEQINQQIEQTRSQITQLNAELDAVSQRRTPRSAGIMAISSALVPQVHITTVTQDGDTFVFHGEADSQELVLNYARALQSSGQFTNVRILSIVNADPLTQDVEFLVEMEQ
ncbi:MAG: PilN domain-containing protein [Anaerolineae bacterium]